MIRVTNICKTYNGCIKAVTNVNADFIEKGISLIMGHSGSGKTTLLQILALMQSPDEGKIEVDSIDITKLSLKEQTVFRRDNFGFVFQSYLLHNKLTALENVILPMYAINGKSFNENKKRAEELLEMVDLKDRTDHYPKQLSGGEQQRVAIARALANNPKYIFADEPTGNLDVDNERKILSIFSELAVDKCVIMVSHNNVVEDYANSIFDMNSGILSKRR